MAALANRLVGGRKGARICGVILLALGLFLALSLISHSPHDFPNSSRAPAERVNLGGQIGAYLSYVSFVGVGYAAYVLPLLFLVWGWNRLLARPLLPLVSRSVGLLGMALFLCVGAGLPEYSSYRAFELGGWVGTSLSNEILVPYAGRSGSAVLLAALLVAAVMLTTDLEPRPVLRAIWRGLAS